MYRTSKKKNPIIKIMKIQKKNESLIWEKKHTLVVNLNKKNPSQLEQQRENNKTTNFNSIYKWKKK